MKRILVWICCSLFLVLLFQAGCNVQRIPEQADIKYDIQGEWEVYRIEAGMFKVMRNCVFIGTIKTGTTQPSGGDPGVYKVGGEHGVQLEFWFWTYDDKGIKVFESYHGEFRSENHMEGTGKYKGEEDPFGTMVAWGANKLN